MRCMEELSRERWEQTRGRKYERSVILLAGRLESS